MGWAFFARSVGAPGSKPAKARISAKALIQAFDIFARLWLAASATAVVPQATSMEDMRLVAYSVAFPLRLLEGPSTDRTERVPPIFAIPDDRVLEGSAIAC